MAKVLLIALILLCACLQACGSDISEENLDGQWDCKAMALSGKIVIDVQKKEFTVTGSSGNSASGSYEIVKIDGNDVHLSLKFGRHPRMDGERLLRFGNDDSFTVLNTPDSDLGIPISCERAK